MQLQIVVTFSRDLLGRLARWYGMTWTHAALRYRRDQPGGTWRTVEATMGGIQEKAWEEFIAHKDAYQVYQMACGLPEVIKREIVAYAWGNVGKPYAYWWLVKIGWRLLRERGTMGMMTYRSHVCSSLVYDCFRYAGVDLLPGQASVWVTPDEVADSDLLEEVQVSRG